MTCSPTCNWHVKWDPSCASIFGRAPHLRWRPHGYQTRQDVHLSAKQVLRDSSSLQTGSAELGQLWVAWCPLQNRSSGNFCPFAPEQRAKNNNTWGYVYTEGLRNIFCVTGSTEVTDCSLKHTLWLVLTAARSVWALSKVEGNPLFRHKTPNWHRLHSTNRQHRHRQTRTPSRMLSRCWADGWSVLRQKS